MNSSFYAALFYRSRYKYEAILQQKMTILQNFEVESSHESLKL